jgi:hypothetical protein
MKDAKLTHPEDAPEPSENEDTEGHSLGTGEFHRFVAKEHDRDAARWADKEALSRAARPNRKSLRDRLTGR